METHKDCINCLICVNHCPILKNPHISFFSYPHTIANLDRELTQMKKIGETPYLCLNCRTCEIVCPRNIKITQAIEKIRRLEFNPSKQ